MPSSSGARIHTLLNNRSSQVSVLIRLQRRKFCFAQVESARFKLRPQIYRFVLSPTKISQARCPIISGPKLIRFVRARKQGRRKRKLECACSLSNYPALPLFLSRRQLFEGRSTAEIVSSQINWRRRIQGDDNNWRLGLAPIDLVP